MNFQETIEIEENIKIKNQTLSIVEDFNRYVKLDVGSFDGAKFKDWSDSHNATYYKIGEDGVISYLCRFIHESYDVRITHDFIFSALKNNYRGLSHFLSSIDMHKKRHEKALKASTL